MKRGLRLRLVGTEGNEQLAAEGSERAGANFWSCPGTDERASETGERALSRERAGVRSREGLACESRLWRLATQLALSRAVGGEWSRSSVTVRNNYDCIAAWPMILAAAAGDCLLQT